MNSPTSSSKTAARFALRASFASAAASIVEWTCKRLVHAFPDSFPGRGGLVEEFSKIKKAPLIAGLRGGQRMKVPAIPEGIGYYLAGV